MKKGAAILVAVIGSDPHGEVGLLLRHGDQKTYVWHLGGPLGVSNSHTQFSQWASKGIVLRRKAKMCIFLSFRKIHIDQQRC